MEIVKPPEEMSAWSERQRAAGRSIALVPTMGCFHAGHLSLMREAARRADLVVVSLFVNPIQFGAGEDLARYPRNLERDAELAAGQGVVVLFAPEAAAMYPSGFQSKISVAGVSEGLCGRSRPGHFDGVATVVAKLFNIVRPRAALFGRKDLQQLAVIRAMVRDLNWPIEIVEHPVVRETDGLAMSSRNTYLSPEERVSARSLSVALGHVRQRVAAGELDPAVLRAEAEAILQQAGVIPEYLEFVEAATLAPAAMVGPDTVLALAAQVGKTRLIDNARLFGAEL